MYSGKEHIQIKNNFSFIVLYHKLSQAFFEISKSCHVKALSSSLIAKL